MELLEDGLVLDVSLELLKPEELGLVELVLPYVDPVWPELEFVLP